MCLFQMFPLLIPFRADVPFPTAEGYLELMNVRTKMLLCASILVSDSLQQQLVAGKHCVLCKEVFI